MMKHMFMAAPALALLLAGCGGVTGTTGVRPAVSNTALRPATNDHRATANPQPGEIMGRDRAALIAQFGQPRLDATEGPATRLQFMSDRCVLDAYLYPPRGGAAPVVTHVDARSPDGADVDRAACIAALRRR